MLASAYFPGGEFGITQDCGSCMPRSKLGPGIAFPLMRIHISLNESIRSLPSHYELLITNRLANVSFRSLNMLHTTDC